MSDLESDMKGVTWGDLLPPFLLTLQQTWTPTRSSEAGETKRQRQAKLFPDIVTDFRRTERVMK